MVIFSERRVWGNLFEKDFPYYTILVELYGILGHFLHHQSYLLSFLSFYFGHTDNLHCFFARFSLQIFLK